MGKYIHLFDTIQEFDSELLANYEDVWVSYTEEDKKLCFSKLNSNDLKEELISTPLSIYALEDGGFYIKQSSYSIGYEYEYKINNGAWKTTNTVYYSSSDNLINLAKGDVLQLRANGINSNSSSPYSNIKFTKNFIAYGNVLSIVNKTEFAENYRSNITAPAYAFYRLFDDNAGLLSAENILLPTKLGEYSCSMMFYKCTNLKNVPKWFPTTVARASCSSMFYGCTQLTLRDDFVLPATTLAQSCYSGMFTNTNITHVPTNMLPATTMAQDCYRSMFSGCKQLTNAPELSAMTLNTSCYSSMFLNCLSLIEPPVLPARTLSTSCYSSMFDGCKDLTSGPALPATTLVSNCYASMFQNCTNLVTAPVLPARTLVSGCYSYMFNGCTKLNYIKALFTTTPSSSYTPNWVKGVASTGDFVKYTSASWSTTGVNGVPSGWTVTKASS